MKEQNRLLQRGDEFGDRHPSLSDDRAKPSHLRSVPAVERHRNFATGVGCMKVALEIRQLIHGMSLANPLAVSM
jgi:hypothetical protein